MYNIKDNLGNIKLVGRSRATVVDNRDPLQRGRIIVKHPQLGETVWIEYLRIPFLFDVPSIGDIVYIECDCGLHTHPIAWGNLTKGEDDAPDIGSEFRRDIPTNRGMKTPGGHLLEFDDGIATLTQDPNDTNFTTDGRGIRITSTAGNKIHIIEDTVNNKQFILLQDAGGNLIKLDYENNQLTINSIGTTKIDTALSKTETVGTDDSLTVGGDKTVDITGDNTETIGGADTLDVTGDKDDTVGGILTITVTGNAIINAAEVQIQGSTGDVLTNVTDPVVDTIFGTPTVGVTTFKAG